MKVVSALIIGLGLLLTTNSAYASPDGTDPSVIINKTMNSGGPSDPVFETNSASDPLVITLTNGNSGPITFDFEPTGDDPTTLSMLYVQLDNALPLEEFDCQSDIFTGQCESFNTGVSDAVGLIFTGGTITAGEEFYAQVPEPQTWIMLVASMLGLLVFGMKYWEPNRSLE